MCRVELNEESVIAMSYVAMKEVAAKKRCSNIASEILRKCFFRGRGLRFEEVKVTKVPGPSLYTLWSSVLLVFRRRHNERTSSRLLITCLTRESGPHPGPAFRPRAYGDTDKGNDGK